MHIQSLAGKWEFHRIGDGEWLPGHVPGCVHTDLMAQGLIPDPFAADNERRVQWVAECDWEYRRKFVPDPETLAEEQVSLVCDGLDTLATVFLNGHKLLQADNMFRRYRRDMTGLLIEGENELVVRFDSPVKYITARQSELRLDSPEVCIPGGPHLRKAPCHFGWDWGPKLPPIGIWKDIRLEGHSSARLTQVHLRQAHNGDTVTLSAHVTIERLSDGPLKVRLRLLHPNGLTQKAEVDLPDGEDEQTPALNVIEPRLWWPNGYGEQPLYTVEVELLSGNRVVDSHRLKIGLRTLELRREPDEHGETFYFIVNGIPIFAKGANWIPPDSFPTRITDDHLEYLIRSAAQANMNMLRVWGGGIYEDDRFYDLCDRYGIMVWQDFIFSCGTYPPDEVFFKNVRAEAVENIRRLRHHASLALWCGNNEMEWGWVEWGWDTPEREPLKEAYDRMFHHMLPEICTAEDPDRPYWPSSPSSGTPFLEPNGGRAGDTHCWDVWHGPELFTGYRRHESRFVSEFGFQALPPMKTIRSFASDTDLNLTSYIMEYHQRSYGGNARIAGYMAAHFRMPRNFEETVYLSQVLQAEAIRTGVEHWRRNRDRVGGTLYWQLNDCWPVVSWSSIDYFGRWKGLHYAIKRLYAPVLLSAEDDGTHVSLHVTNDTTEEWHGKVSWSLERLDGSRLTTGDIPVSVPALSSIRARDLDFADRLDPDSIRDTVLVCDLADEKGTPVRTIVVPFVPDKHLNLTDPGLRFDVQVENGTAIVKLRTQRLARFIWLELDGYDVIFDDNLFDLPGGRTATVTFDAPDGLSPASIRERLRIRSLYG